MRGLAALLVACGTSVAAPIASDPPPDPDPCTVVFSGNSTCEIDAPPPPLHPPTVRLSSVAVPCSPGDHVTFRMRVMIAEKYSATYGQAGAEIAFLGADGLPIQYRGFADVGAVDSWRTLDLNALEESVGIAPQGTQSMSATLEAQSARVLFQGVVLSGCH